MKTMIKVIVKKSQILIFGGFLWVSLPFMPIRKKARIPKVLLKMIGYGGEDGF